jgi:hypothetical protein
MFYSVVWESGRGRPWGYETNLFLRMDLAGVHGSQMHSSNRIPQDIEEHNLQSYLPPLVLV